MIMKNPYNVKAVLKITYILLGLFEGRSSSSCSLQGLSKVIMIENFVNRKLHDSLTFLMFRFFQNPFGE